MQQLVVAQDVAHTGNKAQPLQDVRNMMKQHPIGEHKQEGSEAPVQNMTATAKPSNPPGHSQAQQPQQQPPKMRQSKLSFDGKAQKPVSKQSSTQAETPLTATPAQAGKSDVAVGHPQAEPHAQAPVEAGSCPAASAKPDGPGPAHGVGQPGHGASDGVSDIATGTSLAGLQSVQDAPLPTVAAPHEASAHAVPTVAAPHEASAHAVSTVAAPQEASAGGAKPFSIFLAPAERRKLPKVAKDAGVSPGLQQPALALSEEAAEQPHAEVHAALPAPSFQPQLAPEGVQGEAHVPQQPPAAVVEAATRPVAAAEAASTSEPPLKDNHAGGAGGGGAGGKEVPAAGGEEQGRKPRRGRLSALKPASGASSGIAAAAAAAGAAAAAKAKQQVPPVQQEATCLPLSKLEVPAAVPAEPPGALDDATAAAPAEPGAAPAQPQGAQPQGAQPQGAQPKPRLCSIFMRPEEKKQAKAQKLCKPAVAAVAGSSAGDGAANAASPSALPEQPSAAALSAPTAAVMATATEGMPVAAERIAAPEQGATGVAGPSASPAVAAVQPSGTPDQQQVAAAAAMAAAAGECGASTATTPAVGSAPPVSKKRRGRPSKEAGGKAADGTPKGQGNVAGSNVTPGTGGETAGLVVTPPPAPGSSGQTQEAQQQKQQQTRRARRGSKGKAGATPQDATPEVVDVVTPAPPAAPRGEREQPIMLDLSSSPPDREEEGLPAKRRASEPLPQPQLSKVQPAKQKQQAHGAVGAVAKPVPTMFLGVAERKRLQQEEKRKQQEQAEKEAAEAAAAAATAAAAAAQQPAVEPAVLFVDAPCLPADPFTIPGGSGAPGDASGSKPTSQQPQQPGNAPATSLPINPFFVKRRSAAQGRPGSLGGGDAEAIEGAAGGGPAGGSKRQPLGDMLPPVHVQQLEGMQAAAGSKGGVGSVGGVDAVLQQLLCTRVCEQETAHRAASLATSCGDGESTAAAAAQPGSRAGEAAAADTATDAEAVEAAMARLRAASTTELEGGTVSLASAVAGSRFWPCWPGSRAAVLDPLGHSGRSSGPGSRGLNAENTGLIEGTNQQGAAGAAAAARAGAGACDGSLLRQLARRLAKESAAAGCSQDAELMDVATADDIHAQLQQQVDALICGARGTSSSCSATAELGGDNAAQALQQPQQHVLPWLHKYQPTRAGDVCGNTDCVQQLRAWLHAWQERMAAEVQQQQEKGVQGGGYGGSPARDRGRSAGRGRGGGGRRHAKRRHSSDFIVDDSDDWSEGSDDWGVGSDSDYEGRRRGAASKAGENALALAGPPGCGKTAAAYACAQELGLEVLEVNASSDRTGAQLLRLVGEATQSRRLAHLAQKAQAQAHANPKGTAKAQPGQRSLFGTGPATKSETKGAQGGKPKDAQGGKSKEAQSSKARGKRKTISDDSTSPSPVRNRRASKRSHPPASAAASAPQPGPVAPQAAARNTLILFEGADLLLDEDRGFLSVLCDLIEESKRPVLLLVNGTELPLQLSGLGIQVLHFQPPSREELLRTLALACTAESQLQQRHRRQQQQGQQGQQQPAQGQGQGQRGGAEASGDAGSTLAPEGAQESADEGPCSLTDLEQLIDARGRDLRACLYSAQFWLSRSAIASQPTTRPDSQSVGGHGPAAVCCSDTAAPWLLQGMTAQGCGPVVHTGCALTQGQLQLQLVVAEAAVAASLQGVCEGGGNADGGVAGGSDGGGSGGSSSRGARQEALAGLVNPPNAYGLPVLPAWPLPVEHSREHGDLKGDLVGLAKETAGAAGQGSVVGAATAGATAAPSASGTPHDEQPGSCMGVTQGSEEVAASGAGKVKMQGKAEPSAAAAEPQALSFDPLARQQQLLNYHSACAASHEARLAHVAAQQAAWRQVAAAAAKAARKSALGKRGQRSGRASMPEAGDLQQEVLGVNPSGVEESVDALGMEVGLEAGVPVAEGAGAVESMAVEQPCAGLDQAEVVAEGIECAEDVGGRQPAAGAAAMAEAIPATPPMCIADEAGRGWLSPTAMEGVIDSPVTDRATPASALAPAALLAPLGGNAAQDQGGAPFPVGGGSSWVLQSLLGGGLSGSQEASLPPLGPPPAPPPPLRYPHSKPRSIALNLHPELQALLLLSDLHERLSQAALLAGPCDAAPPAAGVPRAGRHTTRLPHTPLLPGCNVALAWLYGSRRPRTVGDAVRECDGGDAAACCEDLVQEQVRQGSRRALDCASAGAAGGGAPCGGPSIAQHVGACLATALSCAAGTCGPTSHPRSAVGTDAAGPPTGVGAGSVPTFLLPQPDEIPPRCEFLGWRVPQANNALVAMHQRAATEGVGPAVERLAAAAKICRLEAARQLEAARLVGRVRRVPRFRHHLLDACPDMPEPLLLTLLQLGSFGAAATLSTSIVGVQGP